MQYVTLGATGLKVSRLVLGCMSYGDPSGPLQPWCLNEADSLPYYKEALEAGINFFDTANVYSRGVSESITGKAIRQFAKRDEVVIATKVHGIMRPDDPNGRGLSRKAIMQEIDASLTRLGTDYVDLYQIHRYDAVTPIEETLEALHDVVKAGKARYLGASTMWAWQFAQMLAMQKARGWGRFVSMQNHVNLIYREEEREMIPLCRNEGVGLIPYSPLARGRLARAPAEKTKRMDTDRFDKDHYGPNEKADKAIIDRVGEIAAAHGVPRSSVALAWLLNKPGVTAPIIGATKPGQLKDALAAVELKLTADEIKSLEAGYTPRAVVGL